MDIASKSVPWRIGKSVVGTVPSQSGSLIVRGTEMLTPTWKNYDPGSLSIGGDTCASREGTYTAIFTPTDNCVWADGTSDPKSVRWTIKGPVALPVPSIIKSAYRYNGRTTYTPKWSNWSSLLYEGATIRGELSAMEWGYHYVYITPKEGYYWQDDRSQRTRTYYWNISR